MCIKILIFVLVGGLSHLGALGLIDGGVKRQDVDHVFLRFGRRRR
jgi:hypothetical protein